MLNFSTIVSFNFTSVPIAFKSETEHFPVKAFLFIASILDLLTMKNKLCPF